MMNHSNRSVGSSSFQSGTQKGDLHLYAIALKPGEGSLSLSFGIRSFALQQEMIIPAVIRRSRPQFRSNGVRGMDAIRMAAITLIVAGALGLVYGGFSYTKDTHEMKLGPLELSVQEKEEVNVPMWAGVGALVIGGVLLFGGKKR